MGKPITKGQIATAISFCNANVFLDYFSHISSSQTFPYITSAMQLLKIIEPLNINPKKENWYGGRAPQFSPLLFLSTARV
jgi:hypothetical protein